MQCAVLINFSTSSPLRKKKKLKSLEDTVCVSGKTRNMSRDTTTVLVLLFCLIAALMSQCVSGLHTVPFFCLFGCGTAQTCNTEFYTKKPFLARLLQRKMETSKQQCLVDVQPTTATNPGTPNSIDFSSWPSNIVKWGLRRNSTSQRPFLSEYLGTVRTRYIAPLHVGLIFTFLFLTAGAVLPLP